MKEIYYQSSEGEVIRLTEKPYMMLSNTDLLNNEWSVISAGTNNPYITNLNKGMVSSTFQVRVTGNTKADLVNNVEHLESVFDRDCFLKQMGRIYIGEFYRECFVTSASHSKVFEKKDTVIEFVVTSNDGLWRVNSEVAFYGVGGSITGQVADLAVLTASHRSEYIDYEPNEDHTATLNEWRSGRFGDQWLKFDFGAVIEVASFSGLEMQPTPTPILCDAQITDGSTEDVTRTLSAVTGEITDRIMVEDFTTITIDSFGNPEWEDKSLYVTGGQYSYRQVFEGDVLEVGYGEEIAFVLGYTESGLSTIITYTVNEQQWETVQQYSENDTVEISLSDLSCSAIRFRGNYLGSVSGDVSIVSVESVPERDLFDLQYELENVASYAYYEESGTRHFVLDDRRRNGYITFADTGLLLKKIYCSYVRRGDAIVQGRLDDEWEDIVTLTDETDVDFDTHYDQVRVKLVGDTIIQFVAITVETDARIYNESYAPSNVIIEMEGVINNPSVSIGNYVYGANIELESGQKLRIDTKEKTVRRYTSEEEYENIFAQRMEDTFEKVERGENRVDWRGVADIKIILEQARSTPKWN